MRIAIDALIVSRQGAGVAGFARNMIRALLLCDRENEYHLFGKRDCLEPICLAKGERFPNAHIHHTAPIVSASPPLRILWEQIVLPKRLRAIDADVCWYPDHTLSLLDEDHSSVITIYDLSFLRMPGTHPFLRRLYKSGTIRRSVRLASKIICVSEFTRREVSQLLGVPEEHLHVSGAGLEQRFSSESHPEALNALRARYSLPERFILFVGTIEPRKNLVRTIEAYASLKKEEGIPHVLAIAGKRGWLSGEIFRRAREVEKRAPVRFLGYVPDDDLPLLYNASELLVYPSLYEGFGLPVLEAMACGTPVVTSNSSSLPEVVGEAGVLVNPYDVGAIKEGIRRALLDSNLRERLRREGLKRAQTFTWEKAAKETLKVLTLAARERLQAAKNQRSTYA